MYQRNNREAFVGTADDVTTDPNATHLDEMKVFNYVFDYENGALQEPCRDGEAQYEEECVMF